MIINVRGTSGSGKSTLVRAVMAHYQSREPIMAGARRQPWGYILRKDNHRELFVPGHYETPCGGCDTITDTDVTFASVRDHDGWGRDVLFEGLLISANIGRFQQLAKVEERPVVVVVLNLPLDACVASVQERRTARGDERELNPKNTASKHRGVISAAKTLKSVGVDVRVFEEREPALAEVLGLLGLA